MIGLSSLISQVAIASTFKVQKPSGPIYVQDFANVLTNEEKNELIRLGSQLEQQTSIQVALVTVDDLQGQDLDSFANAAFRQYGIGQKGKDNGVLLLYDKSFSEDKSVHYRIEVGYGLEGVITDVKSGEILDTYAVPYREKGVPEKGLVPTYKALVTLLSDEELALPNDGASLESTEDNNGIPWVKIIGVIVIIGLIIIDMTFLGGTFTYLLINVLSAIMRSGGNGGGGGGRGGGGSSGGGGASR